VSPESQNGLSRIRASVLSQIDGSVFGRTSWKEVVDTGHYINNLTGLTGVYSYSVLICQHGGCLTELQQFGVDASFDAPLLPMFSAL
jgi:hypothetical protein